MNKTYDFQVQPPVMFSQLAANDLLSLHDNYLRESKYKSFSSLCLKRNLESTFEPGKINMQRRVNYKNVCYAFVHGFS